MNSNSTNGVKESAIDKMKRWIYIPKINDGGVILSDGTRYSVDGTTGQWRRVFQKGASQRDRRRLYGKMRRANGLTRSQAQKRDVELARIGIGG